MATGDDFDTAQSAMLAAVAALLRPLARLAVAKGIAVHDLEELLRRSLVAAAQEAQPADAPARQVSRVATATGLTRREVARLLVAGAPATGSARRSPATEVFARWLSAPEWADADGRPRTLPRQGPAPSFEALAQSVTRDVHPRSLLETMGLLGLVEVDEARSTVRLVKDRYVPDPADERLWALLGANVGDHLSTAVGNVLGGSPRQLEQAVFADGLSEASLQAVRDLAQAQWQSVVTHLVPQIQRLIDDDRAAAREGSHRVRIGLYSHAAPNAAAAPAAAAARPPKPRRGRRAALPPQKSSSGEPDHE